MAYTVFSHSFPTVKILFLSSTTYVFSLLLFHSHAPNSSPCLFPLCFSHSLSVPFLRPGLQTCSVIHSRAAGVGWQNEVPWFSTGPGTRQGLWSLGSSIDWTTKPWWKKVSSKKFTLRPVVKENGDIVTAASSFPLSSLSKTCPLQRDGMRFSTIWECSVTQYYLHFPPCFMLLSDPWVLPSSQRSLTLRWLANFPIILTVNGRTIDCVILYFASLSLSVLSPLIPRYQTQKPK